MFVLEVFSRFQTFFAGLPGPISFCEERNKPFSEGLSSLARPNLKNLFIGRSYRKFALRTCGPTLWGRPPSPCLFGSATQKAAATGVWEVFYYNIATGKLYGYVTRNTSLHKRLAPQKERGATRLVALPTQGITEFWGPNG